MGGGLLQFNGNTTVPGSGSVTINSSGAVALASTGTYSTVAGWLDSGKIATASSGALALIAASDTETISMTQLRQPEPGRQRQRHLQRRFTPSGTTYRLGGGGGKLTFTPSITGTRASPSADPEPWSSPAPTNTPAARRSAAARSISRRRKPRPARAF